MFQTLWCYLTVIAASASASIVLVLFRRRFRVTRMVAALTVSATLVGVAATFVFSYQSRASLERQEMRKTYDILRSVTRLEAVVTHAESGQRGYILTSGPKYLAQYTIAAEKLPGELEIFNRLIVGDPPLRAAGEALGKTIAEKSAELRSTLDAYAQRNLEEPEASELKAVETLRAKDVALVCLKTLIARHANPSMEMANAA